MESGLHTVGEVELAQDFSRIKNLWRKFDFPPRKSGFRQNFMSEKNYTPGEVIKRVGKGLNRDKLAYFVREGYLQPQTEQHGEQTYKLYRESDIWILDRAMTYIEKYQTRPRAAFEKARKEYEQVELELK
jgi:hypothetical protein